jgi:hypothetical protein
MKPKDLWVVCINDQGWNQHPSFPLVQGQAYLVYEVRKAPSLLTSSQTKYVFLANDNATEVEINALRFQKMETEAVKL